MIKTLLYVIAALLVCGGLLYGAWNLSDAVMRGEPELQTERPVVDVTPGKAGPPQKADSSGLSDEGGSDSPATQPPAQAKKPIGFVKPRDKKTTEDGFYEDSGDTTPGAVKQHRKDKQDPYEPDDREVEDAAGEQQFSDDSREEDLPSEGKPASIKTDNTGANPYAPDSHEAN